MQKSLIEKWKNNTMDEVDEEMFRARLRVASDKIIEGLQAIHEATTEYEDEMKIMGISIVLYADSCYNKSPIGTCRIIEGEGNKLRSCSDDLVEVLKK